MACQFDGIGIAIAHQPALSSAQKISQRIDQCDPWNPFEKRRGFHMGQRMHKENRIFSPGCSASIPPKFAG
jgi:hypothetical protein